MFPVFLSPVSTWGIVRTCCCLSSSGANLSHPNRVAGCTDNKQSRTNSKKATVCDGRAIEEALDDLHQKDEKGPKKGH